MLFSIRWCSRQVSQSSLGSVLSNHLSAAYTSDRRVIIRIRILPLVPLDRFHVSSGKETRVVLHENACSFFRENNWEGQGCESDICHADAVATQVTPPVGEDALDESVHTTGIHRAHCGG